jgi:uncharacterized coiled-coil DUF342 family protein
LTTGLRDNLSKTNKGGDEMEEKQAYQEKMQAQLKDWAAKIDALIAKAEKAGAEKKVEYQEQIQKLQAKKKDAEIKLQELRTAGEETWGDIKVALEKISADLRGALNRFLYGEEGKKE